MLHSVSWQQYIAALLVCLIFWYGYVALRYYRSVIKIKPSTNILTPPVAVMGGIKNDADTGLANSEDLLFATAAPDDISDQTLPKGPADDLLSEAETLIKAYEDSSNKAEFLSLLKLLIGKYEASAHEISLPVVIASLKTFAHQLPFRINDHEWPLTF